jgi:hypothetical protein
MPSEKHIFTTGKTVDLQAVLAVLASNRPVVRAKNQYGWAVLHAAVSTGGAEIVNALVANGAKCIAESQ